MSIEDRDYYRENYAKKQGMHYDTKRAVYKRSPVAKVRQLLTTNDSSSHWSLTVFVWVIVGIAVYAVYRLFR